MAESIGTGTLCLAAPEKVLRKKFKETPVIKTKPSAASKVFGTEELLEMIFLDLPITDLLLLQRVCKH